MAWYHGSFAGGGRDPTLSVSRCPTVGARPAVFPGQVDVLPAERRDVGGRRPGQRPRPARRFRPLDAEHAVFDASEHDVLVLGGIHRAAQGVGLISGAHPRGALPGARSSVRKLSGRPKGLPGASSRLEGQLHEHPRAQADPPPGRGGGRGVRRRGRPRGRAGAAVSERGPFGAAERPAAGAAGGCWR